MYFFGNVIGSKLHAKSMQGFIALLLQVFQIHILPRRLENLVWIYGL